MNGAKKIKAKLVIYNCENLVKYNCEKLMIFNLLFTPCS